MTTYSKQAAGVFDLDKLKRKPQELANEYRTWSPNIWYANGERLDTFEQISICAPTRVSIPVLQSDEAFWAAVLLSDIDCIAATRNQLVQQVRQQAATANTISLALDPQAQSDILRQDSAITKKLNELENTLDINLDTFDSEVIPTASNDTSVSRSQLTVEITDLTPWIGAPSDNLGFKVVLRTAEGREADGTELRINVIDAPKDKSAVLGPGIQDSNDPRIWIITSRLGFMWQDETLPCSIRCYWGSGSLFVTPTITVNRYGAENRKLSPIEYGLP